ncbi:MAG: hypothetical protein J6Y37_13510 [Paludibacteraceae bacterium]|nr:hypothetical protein [Paludibacteraceae bacterium]
MTQDDIIKVCIDLDWAVDFADNGHYVVFSKCNNVNNYDIAFDYDSLSDLPKEIREYAENDYDVKMEAVDMFEQREDYTFKECREASMQNKTNMIALADALAMIN